MLARLQQHADVPPLANLRKHSHILFVLPQASHISSQCPAREIIESLLKRRGMIAAELGKTPLAGTLAHGALAAWAMLDAAKPTYDSHATLRSALQLLLSEKPSSIAIVVLGTAAERKHAAGLAAYCAWVNGAALPVRKKKDDRKPLITIDLFGHVEQGGLDALRARSEGNTLCRELTVLPPNELTPATYRGRIKALAKQCRWRHEEYDLRKLRRMGAGAFCAVAQGSATKDAAIVHLRYSPSGAKRRIALVGKGICFDTGGHNLKPARYMHGMHEDMNGSAVALGILLAVTRMKLPVAIECWMALAQNHISPAAYKQNEVVTALNGTTIEIAHTDAEGRMVLADTLTLAARGKPDLIVDFATLTGSMHVALGTRYSGVFATTDELAARAVAAGRISGERICAFPMDDDYDSALDSKIADVMQCTLDGDADHILAARFLRRFVGDIPWIHVDLSGSSCKGGLGAVNSDVTGFGVGWGTEFVRTFMK